MPITTIRYFSLSSSTLIQFEIIIKRISNENGNTTLPAAFRYALTAQNTHICMPLSFFNSSLSIVDHRQTTAPNHVFVRSKRFACSFAHQPVRCQCNGCIHDQWIHLLSSTDKNSIGIQSVCSERSFFGWR